MSRHQDWDLNCKVYIGNLSSSTSKHEIETIFNKFGTLKNVWVARNPPGFAFVEFDDARDAEDAVKALDGTKCSGTRMRVEMSTGKSRKAGRRRSPDGRSPRGGRFNNSSRRSRTRSRSRSWNRSPYREPDY